MELVLEDVEVDEKPLALNILQVVEDENILELVGAEDDEGILQLVEDEIEDEDPGAELLLLVRGMYRTPQSPPDT